MFIDDETGKTTKAINNATEMKHPVTKNKITIKAGASTRVKAISLARGLTAAIIHYDEPEFTDFIKEIIENSVSTFDTAARAAKRNGKLYGRIFTWIKARCYKVTYSY